MNQTRSTTVTKIVNTSPVAACSAHWEKKLHIICNIEFFPCADCLARFLVKMFFGAEWMRFRPVLHNYFAEIIAKSITRLRKSISQRRLVREKTFSKKPKNLLTNGVGFDIISKYVTAPWPSGKARVCKTLIPGPIPGGASK